MIDIRIGDCLQVMPTLAENGVDSIITDPPYGLDFMGKDWDCGVPSVPFWKAALRVAKPGAILMAFGGTRTFHRLACAIEDAGWELRDTMCYLYGSGFPKSMDISKAIDKAAGAEREVVGARHRNVKPFDDENGWNSNNTTGDFEYTAPTTDSAKLWSGYGTALKPAWEPIIVAMKPIEGTYAENAQKWGVAGLNIDGGRIEHHEPIKFMAAQVHGDKVYGQSGRHEPTTELKESGRWPANLLLDEESAALLGGASRFFYTAKASASERNAGLEDIPQMLTGSYGEFIGDYRDRQTEHRPAANIHPTVKPLDLMRYLCKLTRTPTGGVVLDPFMGSGTTGIACILEHRDFIGIEIDKGYAEIAKKRIADMEGPLFQGGKYGE